MTLLRLEVRTVRFFSQKCVQLQFLESKRQPCLKPSDTHLKSAIELGIFKMPPSDIQTFISWFQSHQGYIDTSALEIIDFPSSEGGRGAVALQDLPVSIQRSRQSTALYTSMSYLFYRERKEGHIVFSIPRSLVLTTRTSQLPARFGVNAWKLAGLHEGWSGLILCMMWEASLAQESKWSTYFGGSTRASEKEYWPDDSNEIPFCIDIMPNKFDTPMFWNEDDLAELKGTAVVGLFRCYPSALFGWTLNLVSLNRQTRQRTS